MLYPLVVSPDFIMKIKDDRQLLDEVKSFLKKFKDYWNDIFILIDDKNQSLDKKYKEITDKFSHENPSLKIVIETFRQLISEGKVAYINIDEKNSSAKTILDNLRQNGVKKIVELPKYFQDEFIKLKNDIAKIYLKDIDDQIMLEKISSITRFSKKICLIDPMIPYHISNIDKTSMPSQIVGKQKNLNNAYVMGFNKLIKNIYKTNFYKNELRILILTTLHPRKIKKFKIKIKNRIESINKTKPINRCEYLDIILENDIWNNLDIFFIKCIEECTSNIVEGFKPKIVVQEHFEKKGWPKPGETVQDVYERSIAADDLNASIEVRKGLDLFDPKSKNKLNRNGSYFMRMNTTDNEKKSAISILKHPNFSADKIHLNFL